MTENTDTSAANNDADNPSESNRRQDIGTDSEGGSGIEQSINDLSEAYSDINIVSEHRFRAGDPAETVQEWLGSLE